MSEKLKDKRLTTNIILTIIVGCSSLLLTLLLPFLLISGKLESIGNYGGFIGGLLGSILSFITVILVYKTYNLQEEELKQTREQLQKQQFETIFFKMLDTIYLLGKDLKSSEMDSSDFFMTYRNRLLRQYSQYSIPSISLSDFDKGHLIRLIEKIEKENHIIIGNLHGDRVEAFQNWLNREVRNEEKYIGTLYQEQFYNEGSSLGHYFRYIYNTIKYVEKEIADKDENKQMEKRDFYVNLIQAQMSNTQLIIMFYNCISKVSYNLKTQTPVFKEILDKYQFFRNIPENLFINSKHQDFYPNTKFKFPHK